MKFRTKLLSFIFAIMLLFSNFNIVIAKENDKDVINWDNEIIYFMLTDRFFDGDKSNNDPYNNGSYDLNHLEAYHGGDFQGIIDKVDYLKELGVTTIWITPIVKNIPFNMAESRGDKQYAYHGYWAEDFTQIDPHLGDEEKLKELIDILHENNIKLMVDVVLNHSGYGTNNLPQFDGMIRENPDGTEITGELAGLPDFKTEDPLVREKIIEWQTSWLEKLKTEKGNTIDYFRVDTVKHVDKDTWKEFKSKLISINPNFKLMGEYFDGTIRNNGGYLSTDMMDSILDFEFKHITKKYARGKFEEQEKILSHRNNNIKDQISTSQFLSSHDENGFLKTMLGDNIGQYFTAVTLQLTAKGQPVIYYGEEIGQSGRKDNFSKGIYSENRYDFDWSKIENNNILNHYKRLIQIRNDYSNVFSYGDRKSIYIDSDVSVFSRKYEGNSILVALNTSEESKKIELDINDIESDLGDLYNLKKIKNNNGKITIEIPANIDGGTAILTEIDNVLENYNLANNNVIYYIVVIFVLVLALLLFIYIKKNRKK